MGLIAREVEARGIPSVSLSSALSITRSVGAPRAVFLDFPLGRTAGRAFDRAMQRDIARHALDLVRDATVPGTVAELDYRWAEDDDWKDGVMRGDSRLERFDTPQYQCALDASLADPECPTCVWLAPARSVGRGAEGTPTTLPRP